MGMVRVVAWLAAALCLAGCAQILGIDAPGLTASDADAGANEPPDGAIDGATIDAPDCDETTDVSMNADHCGRCNHSCGGGACEQGVCQPVALAKDIVELKQLALTADEIYWTEKQRVMSCPLPQGCVLAPRAVADPYDRLGSLAV